MDIFTTAYTPASQSDRLRSVERLTHQGLAAGRGAARPVRATVTERVRARLGRRDV